MLEAAAVGVNDVVLEIGSGPGALTEKLVQHASQVIAVELDDNLASSLRARVEAGNLEVVHQNILTFDFRTLPKGYKVVANIPYYLTSKLLRTLCEASNPFSTAAILVQKEVAERVCAGPGAMSLLSVSVQFYCDVYLGQVVPARLFTPPPKVDSRILRLLFRERPLFEDIETSQFFRLVKVGFAQRRKTLLNAMSSGLRIDRVRTQALLEQAGISPGTRAQNLTLSDWHNLYQICPAPEKL
jgi:16S rRNA (adenine1518-N6/adenine1519-N6)-dimethyltransferase